MIIGGQAVLVHGEPRITKDIDITLGIGTDELPEILQIADAAKLKSLVKDIPEFVKKTMVFPVEDSASGIRIDFIFSLTNYERSAIERCAIIYFGRMKIQFASVEDLIIHKIFSGRERDIEDARKVLLKNSNFDRTYIIKWLDEFGNALNKDFKGIFLAIEKQTQ